MTDIGRSLILAVDFDGTVVEAAYPAIGDLRPGAKEIINLLYDEGHRIIINTCRAGVYEGHVYDFLNAKGIKYHYINCNLPEMIEEFGMDCRKISADFYIDDKCIAGLPTWEEIYTIVTKTALL